MYRIIDTMLFAVYSAVLFLLLACVSIGYSCFCHGDVGPYPEMDYVPWMLAVAMLIVFAARKS